MPVDLKQFCLIDFLAEVRNATSHIELSVTEKGKIEGNTIGTVIKLLYAFLWQEEALVTNQIFLDPFVNQVSARTSLDVIKPGTLVFWTLIYYSRYAQNIACGPNVAQESFQFGLQSLKMSCIQHVC